MGAVWFKHSGAKGQNLQLTGNGNAGADVLDGGEGVKENVEDGCGGSTSRLSLDAKPSSMCVVEVRQGMESVSTCKLR